MAHPCTPGRRRASPRPRPPPSSPPLQLPKQHLPVTGRKADPAPRPSEPPGTSWSNWLCHLNVPKLPAFHSLSSKQRAPPAPSPLAQGGGRASPSRPAGQALLRVQLPTASGGAGLPTSPPFLVPRSPASRRSSAPQLRRRCPPARNALPHPHGAPRGSPLTPAAQCPSWRGPLSPAPATQLTQLLSPTTASRSLSAPQHRDALSVLIYWLPLQRLSPPSSRRAGR